MGEVEDGVYDWMLSNNGKGWDGNGTVSPCTSVHMFHFLTLTSSDAACCHKGSAGLLPQPGPTNASSTPNESKSQVAGIVGPSLASPSQQPRNAPRQGLPLSQPSSPLPPVSPSAALMRQGSKRRNGTGTPTPGQSFGISSNGVQPTSYATPNSAAAYVGVPPASPNGRQNNTTEYTNGYSGQPMHQSLPPGAQLPSQYGRSSPMVLSSVPPVVTSARAMGEQQQPYAAVDDPPVGGSSFWKILTCRCG